MSHPTLKLKKNECRRVRAGHLWIFSNEVDIRATPLSGFAAGEIVTVISNNGKPLANAYINPHSLICARIFSHNTRQDFNSALLQSRIQQALDLRQSLFGLPYYRLIYGEGDLMPGLVVDRFDNTLVLQTSTLGMDIRQTDIIHALDSIVQPDTIILNNQTSARKLEGLDCYVKVIKGDPGDTLQVIENDCRFRFSALHGQKTGWFYDHRLNRQTLREWVKQKRVLDVFSYLGGWGIQAAVAGAEKVTCIESSASACQFIEENAVLNDVGSRVEVINSDAFEAMAQLKRANTQFDVIVLDPPAFIKRKKDIEQGTIAYQRLNKLAMQMLPVNGILVSASCSYHFTREQHLKVLRTCARQLGNPVQIVAEGRTAADHPVHPAIPETNYLSCFMLRVLQE